MAILLKLVILCNFCVFLTGKHHSVTKRSLLFPRATVLQFTYGLSVPLILPRRSINLSLCAQVNYDLPYNLTNLHTRIIAAKSNENLDLSRKVFYDYIKTFIDRVGFNGEQCLLRLICEISEIPMHMDHKENLLEKIVHFAFTPSLDWGSNSSDVYNQKILTAENVGHSSGNCRKEYAECSLPLANLFTAKYLI